jgi:hypothetical protein
VLLVSIVDLLMNSANQLPKDTMLSHQWLSLLLVLLDSLPVKLDKMIAQSALTGIPQILVPNTVFPSQKATELK